MKSILIAALCAVSFTAQAEEAKRDTIHKYTIDKQAVEHFDGSQLEGKHISKYIIAYKENGNVVEKHHVIYTGNEEAKVIRIAKDNDKSLSVVSNKLVGQLIAIDGREVTEEEMLKIKPEDVVSVYVFEPGSEVAKSYGEKCSKGVIKVTTKSANVTIVSDPLVIVDGKEISKKELEEINPNDITHMEVIKSGSKAAEQWGSKGLNGVIIVTTKAGKKE